MSKKSIGSKTLKVGASLLALGAGVAVVTGIGAGIGIGLATSKAVDAIARSIKRIVKEYIILMGIMKHLQDQRNQRALMINQLTSSAADLPL